MTVHPRDIQLFGVNGRTGRYALPRLSSDELAAAARHAISPHLVATARRSQADRESAGLATIMGPGAGIPARAGRKRSPGGERLAHHPVK